MSTTKKQQNKPKLSDSKFYSSIGEGHVYADDLTDYSQKSLEKESSRISLSYIATTLFLALALIGSYFFLARSMSTQDKYLSLISTSSAQQILYQLTYQRTSDIKDVIFDEQNNLRLLAQVRRKLQEEMQDLQKNQLLMKQLIEELDDPVAVEYMKNIYYAEPYYLAKRQEEYALRINKIINAEPKQLMLKNNIWVPIDAIAGSQGILSRGYREVLNEANKRVVIHAKKIRKYQKWIALSLVVILLVEAFLIFRPLVNSLKKTHKKVIDTQHAIQQTQKMQAMGQVATGLAHEFNNFLASILGNAEIALARITSSSPVFEPLKSIVRSSKSSSLLSKRLLTLSRQDLPQRNNILWNDILYENEDLLRQICGHKAKLSINVDSDLWHVLIDASEALQIILNLILNARDAIDDVPGEITVSTKNDLTPKGEMVVLKVYDNGVGIDEELKDKIFEYFFTTKPVGQGTGLGLPSILEIVKQNEGEIEVESTLGAGTAFSILLPRSSLTSNHDVNEEVAKHLNDPSSRQYPILVVDDDAAVLSAAVGLVSELGYAVISAASGVEALECMQKQTCSLVISDVSMPNMSGKELSKKIAEIWPDIPVILSSGLDMENNQDKGSVDKRYFLSKPYDIKELQQALVLAIGAKVAI